MDGDVYRRGFTNPEQTMCPSRCRSVLLSALLLGAPLAVARSECKPDTVKVQPRTLFSGFRIAALHFDDGATSATVNGHGYTMVQARLALAVCKWPAYTLAVTNAGNTEEIHTAYIANGAVSYHPALYLQSSGWELQRRWRNNDIFHPMVAIGTGTTTAEYRYSHRNDDGMWDNRSEGKASARYVAPSIGVEASLFKYVATSLLVGTRMVGQIATPGLDGGALKGQYVTFELEFGKFR